jgi:DNA-directed RNA polymerase specialized sigma24 family protein
VDCPHFREQEISWEVKVGESEELTLGETLTDGVDYENACIEKIYCEEVMKRLDEIMPFARKVGELRLQGKSDREIAMILGCSRTSIYRKLEKAKAILRAEFGKI